MQLGVVYPQTELGGDPSEVRRYALGVEALGFKHLLAYDHVLGADPAVHLGWNGPYDIDTSFHEPLVLFGYLAALCRLELVSGIIILPQRQTALVAKQAAEVDLLSGGHFRLGIGLGWNQVEYQALGQDFEHRGSRASAQVALLRRLWSERSVTAEVGAERVEAAGLSPLPVQRPIPIWFGAQSEPSLRRAGRLADGWFPQAQPGHGLAEAEASVREGAERAGRDPRALGMEGRASWRDGGLAQLLDSIRAWEEAGASHCSVNTMGNGLSSAEAHLDRLSEVAAGIGLSAA